MKKRIGMLIGAFAAAIIIGSSFSAQKVKAEEVELVGVSDELSRFYVSASNELELLGEKFVENDVDNVESFTFDGHTQLLSQFTYVNIHDGYANIRKGPSTDYDIVGRIYGGGVGIAVDEKDGWTKIVSGNVEGYVLSEFLTFGQEAVDMAEQRNKTYRRVIGVYVNLRASATTDSAVLHQIPGYSEVVYLDKATGYDGSTWYKVRYSTTNASYTGYVHGSYLSNGYYYAISNKMVEDLTDKSLIANMIWPFPSDYNIYSDYGMRLHPIDKVYKKHTGLDIGGAYGSSIVSVCDGVVILTAYDNSSGNYVCVEHANGMVSKYLHLSQIYVYKGQRVTQGTPIGACGATGSATSSHLHFTMALNGTLIDPMDYLWRYEWAIKWHCARN